MKIEIKKIRLTILNDYATDKMNLPLLDIFMKNFMIDITNWSLNVKNVVKISKLFEI